MMNPKINDDVYGYNIHNILNISCNIRCLIPEFFYIENEFDYPDLHIKVIYDKINPNNELFRVSNKLYIKNLVSKTVVYYYVNNYVNRINNYLHDYPSPFLQYFITNTLIPSKLLQKGYSFVHAACLEYLNKGFLIVAPPNTGKTYTSISLTKKGFNYLSDDMTITDGKKAYSYPSNLTLTEKHINDFNIDVLFKNRIQLKIRNMVNKIPYAYATEGLRINPKQIISNTIKKASLKYLFFLNKGKEKINELSKEEAYKKVISASHEIQTLHPLLQSYLYYNHDEEINLLELENVKGLIYEELIHNTEVYNLYSNKYNYPEMINSIIKNKH